MNRSKLYGYTVLFLVLGAVLTMGALVFLGLVHMVIQTNMGLHDVGASLAFGYGAAVFAFLSHNWYG